MKNSDITTIARKSGVSIATVSRVLNNEHGVSEEVRRKTRAVMEMQGYRPRSNMKRASRLAILLRSDQLTSSISSQITGVFRYAAEHSLETTCVQYSLGSSISGTHLVETLRRRRCNCVIVPASGEIGPALFEGSEFPALFLDGETAAPGTGFLRPDSYHGAQLMMEYLLKLGHRSVGFIGDEWTSGAKYCLQAYHETLCAAGCSEDDCPVETVGASPDGRKGYHSARHLLAKHPGVTALFCSNDELASSAIWAAVEMGRNVPVDLSVVGFGDIPMSAVSNPPLTTIRQFLDIGGYRAARYLDLKVRGELKELPREVMQTELMVRRSCGPARLNGQETLARRGPSPGER